MADLVLRAKLIEYLATPEPIYSGLAKPTWWMKHHLPYDTRTMRRELERMEADGLVIADRSQRNNTLWALTDKGANHG